MGSLKNRKLRYKEFKKDAEMAMPSRVAFFILKNIKLEPYQIVNFNLKNLSSTNKMKFKRMLYGYNTSRKYSKKTYNYHREGIIHKIEGRKLSPGAILIPEMSLPLIEKKFETFNVNYSNFRIWKQKV